jgi:hypothetical protein
LVADAHRGRLDLVRSDECGSELAPTIPAPPNQNVSPDDDVSRSAPLLHAGNPP